MQNISVFFKRNILTIIVILCMLLVSCDIDIYEGSRPIDYPNTTWTCKEIDMYFTVEENHEDNIAKIIDKNGNEVDISLLWASMSDSAVIVRDTEGENAYFSADCNFGKYQFTMRIVYILDDNFDHLPEVLTFNRTDNK